MERVMIVVKLRPMNSTLEVYRAEAVPGGEAPRGYEEYTGHAADVLTRARTFLEELAADLPPVLGTVQSTSDPLDARTWRDLEDARDFAGDYVRGFPAWRVEPCPNRRFRVRLDPTADLWIATPTPPPGFTRTKKED